MKVAAAVLVLALGGVAQAQMMGGTAEEPAKAAQEMQQDAAPVERAPAEKLFSLHKAAKPKPHGKTVALAPLTPRERAVQMLDRFSYGATPGQVDRVMANPDAWFEAQLNPTAIKDGYLDVKLKAYPTLAMSSAEQATTYPTTGRVREVFEGKQPMPSDPLEKGVYETLVWRWKDQQLAKTPGPDGKLPVLLSDEEIAAKKAAAKETATRVAGELLALPKNKRMDALMAMPAEDRAAATDNGNLSNDVRNLLVNDFAPREREAWNAMSANVQSSYRGRDELQQARMLRDVLSNRQLEQVMTNFWFNHFNIYMPKDSDEWYTTAYERDVIRKNALGKFPELLLATAQSPAMMVYLDNWLSIGPDSLANGVNPANPKSKRGSRGLNENYGREVMELHTVGVNGGYSQADVTALSAILTGWTVTDPGHGGAFAFDYKRHEPGPKYWFGYRIEEDGTVTKVNGPMPKQMFGPSEKAATADSVKQGLAALNILAHAPQTAHFVSWKLVQYFVADQPPAPLVDRVAKTYMATGGDIKAMLREIVHSPEFNSRQYFHNKVKTPEEFIASAYRATETAPDNPSQMANTVRDMGEPLYFALPPTGYYLTAEQWMNSKALIDRLNFSYSLTTGRFGGQRFDAPKLLAEGLMAPGSSAELTALGTARNVEAAAPAKKSPKKLIGWGENAGDVPAVVPTAGAQVTMRVMESTVIGAPVSVETNKLIAQQMAQQPANAGTVDTLNLLTALVLGSPEFQSR